MSPATDNVSYTAKPNNWNVKNITFASLMVGALLVVEGRTALFYSLQLFPFATGTAPNLYGSDVDIYQSVPRVHRQGKKILCSSLPGRELAITTIAALVVFSLLGVYGLIIPALAPYQVLFVLGYSALFTLAIDFPKYEAFKKFGL